MLKSHLIALVFKKISISFYVQEIYYDIYWDFSYISFDLYNLNSDIETKLQSLSKVTIWLKFPFSKDNVNLSVERWIFPVTIDYSITIFGKFINF